MQHPIPFEFNMHKVNKNGQKIKNIIRNLSSSQYYFLSKTLQKTIHGVLTIVAR